MSFLKRSEHLVEIRARLGDGQAAQSVVTAELDNHDGGMKAQYIGQGCERIFGGGAARALVDHFVRISLRIELFLKEGGISLAFLEAQPGCDAVAEADKNWPIGIERAGSGERRGGRQQQTKSDENEFPNVHVSSVAARTYQV